LLFVLRAQIDYNKTHSSEKTNSSQVLVLEQGAASSFVVTPQTLICFPFNPFKFSLATAYKLQLTNVLTPFAGSKHAL